MVIEKSIAKAFQLSGDRWELHANPWSAWTRMITLPFLILAIWSRVWLGWYSLVPIVLLVIWIKFNPTLFKRTTHFRNWMSKAVMGEKYWTEREERPVPKRHHLVIAILIFFQTLGTAVLAFGLWKLNIEITVMGTILVYASKMWFLDRMVWIFEDMQSLEAQ